MTDYLVVPALFSKIVTDLNTRLGTSYNFQYGPVAEVIETLKDMAKDPTESAKKYPLIALFTDIPEVRGDPAYYAEINAGLIIATITEQTYRAADREALIFVPVLYPIYSEFLSQIIQDKPQDILI